ncbi:IS66 family insertion sequence element accessory protein TnpA, partial [Anaerovorax odorimutans]|uniref:IS66 family insertion sequence element accessory protein TnpA n=3 Tax=Anaerovorax odorimutans TaxID=109327 RepID=UPI0004836E7B
MDKLTRVSHEYKVSLWAGRIKECRQSGITVAKWCDQNNIGIKTYYYWMRKLKREVFENLSDELAHSPLVPVDSKPPV